MATLVCSVFACSALSVVTLSSTPVDESAVADIAASVVLHQARHGSCSIRWVSRKPWLPSMPAPREHDRLQERIRRALTEPTPFDRLALVAGGAKPALEYAKRVHRPGSRWPKVLRSLATIDCLHRHVSLVCGDADAALVTSVAPWYARWRGCGYLQRLEPPAWMHAGPGALRMS